MLGLFSEGDKYIRLPSFIKDEEASAGRGASERGRLIRSNTYTHACNETFEGAQHATARIFPRCGSGFRLCGGLRIIGKLLDTGARVFRCL